MKREIPVQGISSVSLARTITPVAEGRAECSYDFGDGSGVGQETRQTISQVVQRAGESGNTFHLCAICHGAL